MFLFAVGILIANSTKNVLYFMRLIIFSEGGMKQIIIGENDAGQRLDKFLRKAVPLLPTGMMYKYIRQKDIKLNGRRCEISHKLAVGEVLSLYISDDFFADRELPLLAAPADIKIVYEDENIILVDKPSGLLVHEGNEKETDTLIGRIQHYLYDKGEYTPESENSFAPTLCNRIDRNTGGIVIAAKNFASLQIMSEKIRLREVTKLYLCLCCGVPKPREWLLRGYHVKDSRTNTVTISKKPVAGAKTALTQYRVLSDNGSESLVEIDLLTGRTHQIRAHMASIGCPLMGDTKYGHEKVKEKGRRYQALYSYKIRFDFKTDSGLLAYLKGREFEVETVPFKL